MKCNLCLNTKKTWSGSDRNCAFDGDDFGNNWNCATVSGIRALSAFVRNGEPSQFPEIKGGVVDDQYFSVIPIGDVPNIESEDGDDSGDLFFFWLWTTWYKNRGCTEQMLLMSDDVPPMVPTEKDLLAIIDYYEAKAGVE